MTTPSATASPEAPAPRYARPFVAVFLVTIALCPLLLIEAWPFNSFRLFSVLRHDAQASWQAVAVDARGVAHPYPVASLGEGYRGFGFLMREFPRAGPTRQAALCGAWLDGARRLDGVAARRVLLYRVRWKLSERVGERARPPTRTLAYTCDAGGAHAAA